MAETECSKILYHCHEEPTGGHLTAKNTARKVLEEGFYQSTLFKDAIAYVKTCDACQRTCRISYKDGLQQKGIQNVEIFDMWGIDFMSPFPSYYDNKYILEVVECFSK